MKKRISILLILCFGLMIAGCGRREDFKEAYRRQGIQALDEGKYDTAIDSFLAALGEGHGVLKDVDMDINYYLGYAYYLNGNDVSAADVFDAVLEYEDKNVEAHYFRALSRLRLGDLTGAEEDFLKYTSADSENYDRYIDVYFCLVDAGYNRDADSYLNATLENAKNMSDYDKGRICYYLKDYSNARVYLEKGKDTTNPETILMLGKTYEAISDYSYAASLYNTYLSDRGNNAAVYNQLGVCRQKMEDYPAALQAFSSGLNLEDPEWEQELLFNEAVTYEYMLDFETARAKMEIYLAKYPKDEAAQREYLFLSTR